MSRQKLVTSWALEKFRVSTELCDVGLEIGENLKQIHMMEERQLYAGIY